MRIALLLSFSLLLLPLGGLVPAQADVVVTQDGVVLEGQVEVLAGGALRVQTVDGAVTLPAEEVQKHRKGIQPRTDIRAALETLAADDVRGRYALALRAEAAGAPNLARSLHEAVVALAPEHAASRRALGHVQVEGAWLPEAEARQAQGLVLFEGAWRLPAEVEALSRREAPPTAPAATDVHRAMRLLARMATEQGPLRDAARIAFARTPDVLQHAAARQSLFAKAPAVRIEAARILGTRGDEAALKALIFSGARDTHGDVRAAAVEAAQSFGHDDLAVPFIRALGSESPRLAANAAQALARIGDQRAAGYIVKRMTSHGHSSRNYVAFLNQISYVRDYDVEIAQASNIANPDVGTIMEGVVLDVKIRDASITKTWLEPFFVDALSQLAGQPFRNRGEALAWYDANRDRLPGFPPKPNRRAPKRGLRGKVIGAPASR